MRHWCRRCHLIEYRNIGTPLQTNTGSEWIRHRIDYRPTADLIDRSVEWNLSDRDDQERWYQECTRNGGGRTEWMPSRGSECRSDECHRQEHVSTSRYWRSLNTECNIRHWILVSHASIVWSSSDTGQYAYCPLTLRLIAASIDNTGHWRATYLDYAGDFDWWVQHAERHPPLPSPEIRLTSISSSYRGWDFEYWRPTLNVTLITLIGFISQQDIRGLAWIPMSILGPRLHFPLGIGRIGTLMKSGWILNNEYWH